MSRHLRVTVHTGQSPSLILGWRRLAQTQVGSFCTGSPKPPWYLISSLSRKVLHFEKSRHKAQSRGPNRPLWIIRSLDPLGNGGWISRSKPLHKLRATCYCARGSRVLILKGCHSMARRTLLQNTEKEVYRPSILECGHEQGVVPLTS